MAVKIQVEVFWTSPWRWRQQSPLKCFYPTATLHSVHNSEDFDLNIFICCFVRVRNLVFYSS